MGGGAQKFILPCVSSVEENIKLAEPSCDLIFTMIFGEKK